MTLENMITDDSIEDSALELERDICKGVKKISKKYPLSKFKEFVSKYLKTENNEDQWTFDYESYALHNASLREDYTEPLEEWTIDYYRDRWDLEKYNNERIRL